MTCLATLNHFLKCRIFIFRLQDFHFQITQVEYCCQTRYTQIIEQSGVEIFSLRTIFAQCSSSSSCSSFISEYWEVELRDQVMKGWSVTQYIIISSSSFAQIILESKIVACPPRSLHGFPGLLFICYCSYCNFWLLIICYRVEFMPEITSQLLLKAICSGCAIQLESEQTPFSQTDSDRLSI